MPELPEVQTTVSGLSMVLPKLVIKDTWSSWPRMLRHETDASFRKKVVGKKVLSVKRRAKHILINLEKDLTIVIHMKMTGHLLFGKYEKHGNFWKPALSEKNTALRDPYNRFVRFVFSFSNGKHLAFCDTRKFGYLAIEKTSNLENSPFLSHLGPEPLLENFTEKIFEERISRRKKSKIKTVLMDQTIISGIGNIYSDEILFRAKVHPERPVFSLSKKKLRSIFDNIKTTLNRGIEFGGDSTSDYRNIKGERGHFHETHLAYRRTGRRCSLKNCHGIILRKIVNGRSAHFCSIHQK